MRVLVTGSNGYIGTVLSAMLTEQGHTVLGVDNNLQAVDPPGIFLRRFRTSFEHPFVAKNIMMYNIDKIVHLAASSTVGPDAKDPVTYYWNNTGNTATFLKNLIDEGWAGQFVFASTAAVYGVGKDSLTEADPVAPFNVYGRSKLYCEDIINSMRSLYDIDATIFRFFNVAGAHNQYGEEAEDTHLLSRICNAAATNDMFKIYGDDYFTEDGTCVRDYVDVRDVCRAIIFALQNDIVGTYNLGTKQGTSVKDMITKFQSLTGQQLNWEVAARRPGDPSFLVADPTKFKQCGFEYKYGIDDIINSSWGYFKNGI